MIWKINFGLWAVAWAGLWDKRVWADYEQLFKPVFSLFRGQKKFKVFLKKISNSVNMKLHLEDKFGRYWPSPPGTFHVLIGKFSYFIIRFLN